MIFSVIGSVKAQLCLISQQVMNAPSLACRQKERKLDDEAMNVYEVKIQFEVSLHTNCTTG